MFYSDCIMTVSAEIFWPLKTTLIWKFSSQYDNLKQILFYRLKIVTELKIKMHKQSYQLGYLSSVFQPIKISIKYCMNIFQPLRIITKHSFNVSQPIRTLITYFLNIFQHFIYFLIIFQPFIYNPDMADDQKTETKKPKLLRYYSPVNIYF